MTPDQISQLADIHSGMVWLWLSVLPVFGLAFAVILVYVEKIHRLVEKTHQEVTRDEPCGCDPCEFMRHTYWDEPGQRPADLTPGNAWTALNDMYRWMLKDDRKYTDGTD